MLFITSVLLAMGPGSAVAGEAPLEGAAVACDFFEAQLIGVLCGHTAYVAPSGQFSDETIKRTITVAPGGVRFGHGHGGGTTVEKFDYRNAYESATLAISPWTGVRIHVTGEAFQFDDAASSQTSGAGFHNLNSATTHDSGGIGGWQTIGAEATLWDRQTTTGRYVFNLAGGLQMFNGGGPHRSRDLQQIGWTSGADWRLGGSGLSLDYFAATFFERLDNPGVLQVESTTRLLLASDSLGVAVGPRLEGTSVLWHAPGDNTGWSEARLGGEALLAPFRLTPVPVLRDMTLDLVGMHSVGQAALVPDGYGASSAYLFAATARFNFRF